MGSARPGFIALKEARNTEQVERYLPATSLCLESRCHQSSTGLRSNESGSLTFSMIAVAWDKQTCMKKTPGFPAMLQEGVSGRVGRPLAIQSVHGIQKHPIRQSQWRLVAPRFRRESHG